MRFVLTVAQDRGVPHQLELDAHDREAALRQAGDLGLNVLACHGGNRLLGVLGMTFGKRPNVNHAVLVEQIRDLLQAGLSAIEALEAIGRGSAGATAETIANLRQQLLEGKPLAAALRTDNSFPPLLIALVSAAELTSDLTTALDRYLEHYKASMELRHRLYSAAIYPVLLLVVGGLVLAFLALVVMPRFAMVFEGMGSQLPWAAQAMVAWAGWVKSAKAWWLLPIGLFVGLFTALTSTKSARAWALRKILGIRVVRDLAAAHFLARWYRATGMLLQGGIPLPESLGLTNELLPLHLRLQGQQVRSSLEGGLSPSEAYGLHHMATPVAQQLLLGGERTGDLGGVLMRVAQFHESEVSRSVERFMKTLEPVVMVFIGLCVGLVVVLMYMPIFELASAIS